MSEQILRVGARDSTLSLLQATTALERIREQTQLTFELCPFSSPGDRDQITDLRQTPSDFFTKDLDDALINRTID
ncbi:MAG: hydroxymethylbilane synthase, partial [Kiritimatiellae bacterium]|nr:hydroxymethylbilane synthase [Kiritimatiellia bacterium]